MISGGTCFDGRHGQRCGALSWKRRGENRFIKQSLVCIGTTVEASDGRAEDVKEDITECSSSVVMDDCRGSSHSVLAKVSQDSDGISSRTSAHRLLPNRVDTSNADGTWERCPQPRDKPPRCSLRHLGADAARAASVTS